MSNSGCFKLTITAEGLQRVMPVRLGAAEIGRSPRSAIHLDQRNVSRRHARLLRHGHKVWVEDLTSANGSYVNGEKICGRARVFRNDVIRLGDVELELSGENLRYRDDETTDRTGPLDFIALQEPQPAIRMPRSERTMTVPAPVGDIEAGTATLHDTDPTATLAPPVTAPTAFLHDTDPAATPGLPAIEPTTTVRDADPTVRSAVVPATDPRWIYRDGSVRPVVLVLGAAVVFGCLLVVGAWALRANRAAPIAQITAIATPAAASLDPAVTAARAGRWLEATRLAKEALSVDPDNALALNLLMRGSDAIRSDETLTAALAARARGDWRACWRIINGIPPEQRTGVYGELTADAWHGLRAALLQRAMQSLDGGDLMATDEVLAELADLGIAGDEVNRITELLQQQRRTRRRRRVHRRAVRVGE